VKEIDRVYRSSDKSIEMDTETCSMMADRDDMQIWFGRFTGRKEATLSRLHIRSPEKQVAVALLPWDTADFKTSKTMLAWCIQDAELTINLPGVREIFGVNWLGKRIYKIQPKKRTKKSITFMSKRDDDIFHYELVR
jgi:hypothetical protein